MTKFFEWFRSEAHRAYLYRVLAAVGAALLLAGLVTPDQVDAVLRVVSAVLLAGGSGLAAANSSTRKG